MSSFVYITQKKVKYSYRINKSVYTIFFLFFLLFYFLPFVSNLLFPVEYSYLYIGTDSKYNFLFIPLFFVIVVFFDFCIPKLRIFNFNVVGSLYKLSTFNLFVVFIFLGLAVNFSIKYDLSFRQNSENSLISSGFDVIPLLAVRSYLRVYIFYIFVNRINSFPAFRFENLSLILILIGLVLTITASTDMIYIFLTLVLFVNKEGFFFKRKLVRKKNMILISFRWLMIIIMTFFLIISIIFIGNANKIGVYDYFDVISDTENLKLVFISTLLRISNWYASVLAIAHVDFFENSVAFTTLSGIFNNFIFQVKLLSGIVGVKPEVWSANRMSYLQTYVDLSHNTTGSSPGLVASIFYIPFFPIGLFIIAFYTMMVLRNLSQAFYTTQLKLNSLGLLIVLYFILPFLDSPLDLMNILSPTVIFAFCFLGATDRIASDIKRFI